MRVAACLLLVLLLTVLLTVPPHATADDAPGEVRAARKSMRAHVDTLLASPEPRRQAWGAHLAGNLSSMGLDTVILHDLLGILQYHGRSRSPESRRLTCATFDALIRLQLVVKPEKIFPLIHDYPDAVVTLLAFHSTAHQSFLESALPFGLPTGPWMAVCNILATLESPVLAAHLLDGMVIRITPHVLQSKHDEIEESWDPNRTYIGPEIEVPPIADDWHPVAFHELSDHVHAGWIVDAPGTHNVYRHRWEDTFGGTRRRLVRMPRNTFRFVALADLMKRPVDALPVRERERMTIHWKGEKDDVAKVQKRWREVRSAYADLLCVLRRAELLTSRQANELGPSIVVQATWAGKSKRTLPDVPEPR